MSSISQTADVCKGFSMTGLASLIRPLESFFRTRTVNRAARIYHGDYSYDLVPGTAIRDFNNMKKVTRIQAGDFYVCVFDKPRYQGSYVLLKPGEELLGECGSVIVNNERISIDYARQNATAGEKYWELPGPMYHMRFGGSYRYM